MFFLFIKIGFLLIIVQYIVYKSLNLVFVKLFQFAIFLYLLLYLILRGYSGGVFKGLLIFDPILKLYINLLISYHKFWITFRKSHLFFFFFTIFIIFHWTHLDLIFLNTMGVGGVRYPYFYVKLNNFYVADVEEVFLASKYTYTNTFNFNEFYFLKLTQNTPSFSKFSVIYLDNYEIGGFNTFVNINRTIYLSYYYYYLFALYIIIVFIIFYLILMFFYSISAIKEIRSALLQKAFCTYTKN